MRLIDADALWMDVIHSGEGFGMYSGTKWYICDEVTAWMPLPEPYKDAQ